MVQEIRYLKILNFKFKREKACTTTKATLTFLKILNTDDEQPNMPLIL